MEGDNLPDINVLSFLLLIKILPKVEKIVKLM